MINKKTFNFLNQFNSFFNNIFRDFYLNSKFYNNKISKITDRTLEYKPSLNLLDCIINQENKKTKVEELYLNSIWDYKNSNPNSEKKLHSFFWLFSLDLKSSKNITQSVILNWIKKNETYEKNKWEIDTLSKRVISWISSAKLTYEDSDDNYKHRFNSMIQKQINHLIYEINKSKWVDDKMIGCAAIILAGLAYNEKDKYLAFGLNLLKKIINISFDKEGFPKTRNIQQLVFYLKYFVLIREWLKESQVNIPRYLDEIIFYQGNSYNLFCEGNDNSFLFNGNNQFKFKELSTYLSNHGYKFSNNTNEIGGYAILKNKKNAVIMDIGPSPDRQFSKNYQSGALSFEILSNNYKLISNSGYFKKKNHKLNSISRSSAAQSTLIIDNHSSCKIDTVSHEVKQGLRIINKKVKQEKNYWKIVSSHDGYLKRYGVIHERKIEFFVKDKKFVGHDTLFKKRNQKKNNFEIRFHILPETKIMKTQDEKSILIDLNGEGWRFSCPGHLIHIETGLYFGRKNTFTENQNFFISGITSNEDQIIKWELNKI